MNNRNTRYEEKNKNDPQVNASNDGIALDGVTLIVAKESNYISADGVVVDGEIGVEESDINGRPMVAYKTKGDIVYRGSKIVSGKAYLKVSKDANESFNCVLHRKAKKVRRKHSELVHSLLFSLVVVLGAIVALSVIMILIFIGKGKFNTQEGINESFAIIGKCTPLIFPFGFFLLTVIVLVINSISLAKRNIYVKNYFVLNELSRVDVVCFDKTGVLTSNEVTIHKVVTFDGSMPESYISQIISNVLCAVDENTPLNNALRKIYDFELSNVVKASLGYSNKTHYMGASFKGGKTFLIGLPSMMKIKNKIGVNKRCEEYSKNGLTVYILAEGNGEIINDHYQGDLTAIAMIITSETVRNSLSKLFYYFVDNNVDVKIISGDDAERVSSLAYKEGLLSAINFVSLENVSLRDTKLLADKYTVFGKATPEQKQVIIETLQKHKKSVAMVGNGDNDILALKRANLSICNLSSTDEVKKVSQIVIDDNSVSELPDLANKGNRLTNNLIKIATLAMIKALFAVLLVTLSILTTLSDKYNYLISLNIFLVWDFVTTVLLSILILFDKNDEKIKGTFLKNVIEKALPASLLLFASAFTVFILFIMQENHATNCGIYKNSIASVMSVIVYTALCGMVLYKMFKPVNAFNRIVLISYFVMNFIGLLLVGIITSITNKPGFLTGLTFDSMSFPAYLACVFITAILAAIYLLIYSVIESFRKDNENEN